MTTITAYNLVFICNRECILNCDRYISRISREAPCESILAKFCMLRDVADVITRTRAHFGVCKLRDYGMQGGQILASPTEMAGHPYNSAVLPRSL